MKKLSLISFVVGLMLSSFSMASDCPFHDSTDRFTPVKAMAITPRNETAPPLVRGAGQSGNQGADGVAPRGQSLM